MGQSIAPRAYPLRQFGENAFAFRTECGNEYTIRFARYWQEEFLTLYLGIELAIYEIYFEVAEIRDHRYDPRIQYTVMDTIINFLSVENRVGFFDIHREDGRGLENLRVYKLWLTMYARRMGKPVSLIGRILHLPGQDDAHIACIVHHNNEILTADNSEAVLDTALREIFPRAQLENL